MSNDLVKNRTSQTIPYKQAIEGGWRPADSAPRVNTREVSLSVETQAVPFFVNWNQYIECIPHPGR